MCIAYFFPRVCEMHFNPKTDPQKSRVFWHLFFYAVARAKKSPFNMSSAKSTVLDTHLGLVGTTLLTTHLTKKFFQQFWQSSYSQSVQNCVLGWR